MPTLQTFERDDYAKLLAYDVKDATVATDNNNALEPDANNRTIIIGVGGTGVKTLDYIKGALIKRLKPTWSQYVAFLGVDASWTELENAHYIHAHEEGVCITQTGVGVRMQNHATYPRAVRRFMLDGANPNTPVHLGPLDNDGAGMTRLIGKVKVHDQQPGSAGVDETIVNKLISIIANMQLPPALAGGAPSFYDVYVIGSGSGGTGSGAFLEMPALIRKAMGNQPVHIHGILYMPDTLTGLVPESAGQLKANGYATLKEMNYFQGMKMRTDYKEVWTFNNPAQPELEISADKGYFDIPYLIGSPGAAAADASAIARETIAEFLISMLVKATPIPGANPFLTSAFFSNAINVIPQSDKEVDPGNPNKEAHGVAHEFPKCFASIGFAEASAPEKVIRAYAVKEICQGAGLKPVSDDQLDALKNSSDDKVVLLPFRGIGQMDNATQGTASAKSIVKPIETIHQVINNGAFNFIADLKISPDALTWQAIKDNTFENAGVQEKVKAVVEARTNDAAMELLRKFIRDKYTEFRKNVVAYVQKEGPYAFVNLYKGNFTPVNGDGGIGIARMLQNLVDGKKMEGNPHGVLTVEKAAANKQDAKRAIDTTRKPLIDIHNVMPTQRNAWLEATDNLAKAHINTKRRELALGKNGALMDLFVRPAAYLAEQIEAFGHLLCALSDVYSEHGGDMDTSNKFAAATDTLTEVNVASIHTESYQWLKRQADASVAAVKAKDFRDNLVAAFFEDPAAWLEVPQHLVTSNAAGEIKLVTPDKPVPARELFDRFATDNIPLTVDVSILTLFQELQQKGVSYNQTADILMQKLFTKSQIRFNGETHEKYVHRYVKYPNSINLGAGGAQIVAAIQQAASHYGVPASSVYPSEDTNTIMFYQQATNMEVYRVGNLADWENEYETRVRQPLSLLHGKSPDVIMVANPDGGVTYKEGQKWADYPSIVYRKNPERPDPVTGVVCHEGQVRQKLHQEVMEAKKLGVLYSEQVAPNQWVIQRVNCDKSTQWHFDPTMCTPDAVTGLLPQGRSLVDAVAMQNGKQLWQMTRVVRLETAKLFSAPAATEAYAWEYAERVLRAHHPMMCEIRNTVNDYFRKWDAQVEEFNGTVLATRRPAMLVYLLKANILTRRADGAWVWNKVDGTVQMVANYAQNMMLFLQGREKNHITGGLLAYELFKRVDMAMPGDVLKNEYLRGKELINQWINLGDMIPLQSGQALAQIVEEEHAALVAKGAGDGVMPTTTAFIQSMTAVEPDQNELKKIQEFYHRTALWTLL